jgi:hypothetical protein
MPWTLVAQRRNAVAQRRNAESGDVMVPVRSAAPCSSNGSLNCSLSPPVPGTHYSVWLWVGLGSSTTEALAPTLALAIALDEPAVAPAAQLAGSKGQ